MTRPRPTGPRRSSAAGARIRALAAADAAVYRALRLRSLREHRDSFTSTYEEEARRPLADSRKRLERTGKRRDDFILGAFAADGAMIGVAGLERLPRRQERHKSRLFGVYVAADHGGQGVGRALVRAVIARARRIAGLEQVHLTVTRSNAAAVRLYRREGFVVYGVERAAVRLAGGGTVDKNHMVLFL
ncbi:MAG: GNAT family N-acetyltransferase [Alphaproteobacteria bacterium]|nr:GNAT family N-acetyltransferase [Alphaproteobacteria bacterium]